jgi:hypothetical protein
MVHTVIKGRELWAIEFCHIRTQLIERPAEDRTKLAERRGSSAGHGGKRGLVEEASSIISREQCSTVEDAAGQVAGVYSSEGI